MKKLFFSDKFSLTHAVLGGTKTMTRRIEKFEPSARLYDEVYNIEGGMNDKGQWIFTLFNKYGEIIGDIIPRYNVGEVVAIAQSYKKIVHDSEELNDILTDNDGHPREEYKAGWNNKMFTRADLLIHHIKITDVRLERLQAISEEDIMCEGIEYANGGYYVNYNKETHSRTWLGNTLHDAYAALINKISGKGTWERNPWVVVYEFEKVEKKFQRRIDDYERYERNNNKR